MPTTNYPTKSQLTKRQVRALGLLAQMLTDVRDFALADPKAAKAAEVEWCQKDAVLRAWCLYAIGKISLQDCPKEVWSEAERAEMLDYASTQPKPDNHKPAFKFGTIASDLRRRINNGEARDWYWQNIVDNGYDVGDLTETDLVLPKSDGKDRQGGGGRKQRLLFRRK